jgi:molybdopterin synthase catalytic subunit
MTVRLQTEPFEPGALLTAFAAGRTETGAVVSFTGIARAEAGATTTLELEAYPGLHRRGDRADRRGGGGPLGLQDWLVVHRVGAIAPGEPVVFVATASRHRREAFEACDHLMDYLKSRAPFWKKEHGPDGARWIEPTDRDRTDAQRWET